MNAIERFLRELDRAYVPERPGRQPNDRADISAMVDMDLVDHGLLVARFRAAVDYQQHTAKADDLPDYVQHLHTVERDMLLVAPSDVELPHWI